MLRRATAVLSSFLLGLLPTFSGAGLSLGTVEGVVRVEGRPLVGMDVTLVELKSGAIHRVKTGRDGGYRLEVAPGEYVVANSAGAGLSLGRGPSVLNVAAGRVAMADLDLLPVAMQAPAAGATGSGIQHEPIGCLVAGQFPLIDAIIEPIASVARARVYFKSALGTAYYYVEMAPAEGKFLGKLPRPKVEASPITYYVQATTTEFGESQTAEIEAQVVADASECPEGKRVAAIGPAGAVTVFSASTGAAVSAVGFAAGGLTLAASSVAAVVATAAAITTNIVVNTTTSTTSTTTTTTTTSTTTTTTTSTTTTTTTTLLPECASPPTRCPCTVNGQFPPPSDQFGFPVGVQNPCKPGEIRP